jgi:hypothetical protein
VAREMRMSERGVHVAAIGEARDASLGPSSRCPRHSVPAVKQTRVGEKNSISHTAHWPGHAPSISRVIGWKGGWGALFGGMSNDDDIRLIERLNPVQTPFTVKTI